ncbi:growth-regulating factor 5-like isoform X2 [Malania oleifera]|uniref:growth-regulating factor 5-like isoform X2 n=1 Tax=Malania oleifera TaxID=397392 RepID=UPI0025ADD009|nr:growth-regulating factor 5-like isoform X2 [Malania oleifera]
MMNARNRSPFTAAQWQELEHQALIFKYMESGAPVPPDLIYPSKRSLTLDSSMSSRLFPHQPIGWGCFQMGFGRKTDPEPGRCRRTDGKKWRCSKEAFPDSKYCERHMHRGKNRSRKPVEVMSTTNNPLSISISSFNSNICSSTPTPTPNPNPPPYSLSSLSSSSMASAETQHFHHHPNYQNPPDLYPFLYPHSSSSTTPCTYPSPQSNTTHNLFFDSGPYSQAADKDYRYFQGMREGADERAFFPEASGNVKSLNDAYYTPLTMSSSKGYSKLEYQSLTDDSKQQQEQQQEQHCFVMGTDFKSAKPTKGDGEREREAQKPQQYHFFTDWPLKNRDSWLDLEEDPSTHASFSTTQLSISLPMSSQDFLASNSRVHTAG